LVQDAAQGQGISDCLSFLDIVLDHELRLVGKPLQPQDACLEVVGSYPLIELKSNNPRLLRQGCVACEHALDVVASFFLVAKVMQRCGEDAIGHHQIDRIRGSSHQRGEAPGLLERGAKLPDIELIGFRNGRFAGGAKPVGTIVVARHRGGRGSRLEQSANHRIRRQNGVREGSAQRFRARHASPRR
jgi:hypothetical protein